MNRREHVEAVLRLEGLAAAAQARAAAIRKALAEQARAELDAQGTAPTWRLPGIGTVTLPVTKDTVVVADEAGLLDWVRRHHPGEIVAQVRTSFRDALLRRLVIDGETVIHPDTGEEMPALAVRQGGHPRALSFRLDQAAKDSAQAEAELTLEGLALLAQETPGHLAPAELPAADVAQPPEGSDG